MVRIVVLLWIRWRLRCRYSCCLVYLVCSYLTCFFFEISYVVLVYYRDKSNWILAYILSENTSCTLGDKVLSAATDTTIKAARYVVPARWHISARADNGGKLDQGADDISAEVQIVPEDEVKPTFRTPCKYTRKFWRGARRAFCVNFLLACGEVNKFT